MTFPLISDNRKIFTVSDVTTDITSLLEDNFHSVWITGEVSNFKASANGHFYFTLKDDKAQIACVMFRGSNYALKFSIENGQALVLHGKITVYAQRGQHQIIVDHCEPKGIGSLQLAFEQLKEKLTKEGLFEEMHKKKLPFLPQKVGIITSSKGAVLHDMLHIIRRRFPNMDLVFAAVQVQGDGASADIARAINEMSARDDIDVMIVGRGGGSMEDLWAFNEEVVVRSLFNCRIPVVSAVGHETDFTLADFVADVRAPTPSAAAELVVPVKADIEAVITQKVSRLKNSFFDLFEAWKEKINYSLRLLGNPKKAIEHKRIQIDDKTFQLVQAMKGQLFRLRHELSDRRLPDLQSKINSLKIRVNGMKDTLMALSPEEALKRGYALVLKAGIPVSDARDLLVDSEVDIRLSRGSLKAKILKVLEN